MKKKIMVTILFETKEAAQIFADMLLGDWDSCNGVDLEYLDSRAIDLAVNLTRKNSDLTCNWCQAGDSCRYLTMKNLSFFLKLLIIKIFRDFIDEIELSVGKKLLRNFCFLLSFALLIFVLNYLLIGRSLENENCLVRELKIADILAATRTLFCLPLCFSLILALRQIEDSGKYILFSTSGVLLFSVFKDIIEIATLVLFCP